MSTIGKNEDDWRTDCTDIISVLDKARQEARFTDVQFILKKGKSKKVFNVHKIILACGSAAFEKMFFGPMAEMKDTVKTDDDPEAFEILMNFFYGKCKKMSSFISVWKLYIIGDKYLVPKILDIAKRHIESITISEDDFWDVVESDVFSHPLFFDKVNPYLKENAETIIKSRKFLHVQESFLDQLLQMESLNVCEFDLLLAATEWGYQNFKSANMKGLLKFYKHIRFAILTVDEYFRFIDRYPEAIESKSSLEILQYLYTPYGRCLPLWCTTNHVARKFQFQQEKVTDTCLQPQDVQMDVFCDFDQNF